MSFLPAGICIYFISLFLTVRITSVTLFHLKITDPHITTSGRFVTSLFINESSQFPFHIFTSSITVFYRSYRPRFIHFKLIKFTVLSRCSQILQVPSIHFKTLDDRMVTRSDLSTEYQ